MWADDYISFCWQMKEFSTTVMPFANSADGRSALKRIDEFNYASYTKPWVSLGAAEERDYMVPVLRDGYDGKYSSTEISQRKSKKYGESMIFVVRGRSSATRARTPSRGHLANSGWAR